MPFNGSGSFSRLYSWVADKAAGLDISSSRMDSDSNDIAANGLGLCLTRDGQGAPTGNLPMNGFRHTNVQSGVNRTDYSAVQQDQDGSLWWVTAGGSSDAITASYSPTVGALVDGMVRAFRATASNATTTPTLNVDGNGALTITKAGGSALAAGDIPGNLAEVVVRYNAANTRWELLNPAPTSTSIANCVQKLAVLTASNSASLSDTSHITSSYNSYEFVFENIIPVSNNVQLFARVSTNGGSSYLSSSYISTGGYSNGAGSGVLTGFVSGMALCSSNNISNSSGHGLNGRALLCNPSGGTARTYMVGLTAYLNGSGPSAEVFDLMSYQDGANTAINAIEFLMSGGNISSGKIVIYGLP